MTVYPCPAECGDGPFASQNGAVMHAINKTDEVHDSITDKASAYAALEGVQNPEAADESEGTPETTPEDKSEVTPEDGSEGSTVEFPTAPDGPNDDPEGVESDPDPVPDLDDEGDDPTPTDPTPSSDSSSGSGTGIAAALGLAAVGSLAYVTLRNRGGGSQSQTADEGPGFEVV